MKTVGNSNYMGRYKRLFLLLFKIPSRINDHNVLWGLSHKVNKQTKTQHKDWEETNLSILLEGSYAI